MNDFYVYSYRKNGIPFYIGKGCKYRYRDIRGHRYNTYLYNTIQKMRRSGVCVDEFTVFESKNLTEKEAFLLEIDLIKKYGKRCDNTGCLLNLTEGGEGVKPTEIKCRLYKYKDDIVRMYIDEKKTMKEIAAKFKDTVTVVNKVLQICNITMRRGGVREPILPSNIVEEFMNTPKATVSSFAKKYRCDCSYMKKILVNGGVRIVDGHKFGKGGPEKYNINGVVEEYNKGISVNRIAKKYTVDNSVIKRILVESGVKNIRDGRYKLRSKI